MSQHAKYRAYYRALLAFLREERPADTWIARRALRWGYQQWCCGFGPAPGHRRPRALLR
jgi:hypothetical protein